MRGRKPVLLTLSDEERAALESIVRRRGSGEALAQRARIVLACAEPDSTNAGVARALGVSRSSAIVWRQRFLAHRLEGLVDQPRSGAPRQVGDDQIERLIALTLETQPDNATHWSTRAMARQAGMSQTMVSRVWHAFGLAPHRQKTFPLSSDPALVDKVRDMVGLYMASPDRALVLCVDEKPQIQAVERTAPVLPMRPGQPERAIHDDKQHATTDLLAALDVRTGTVIGARKGRHHAVAFCAFLDEVEAAVPAELDVHLVLDNAATYKTRLIFDWLVKRSRWHLHFTPTSASWLNLIEGWFALLTRRRLQQGVFTSTADLGAAIHAYIDQTNADPKPFVWTKTSDAMAWPTLRRSVP
ncbi:IS630 family transposase [Methylobacterium iners]|uniref:IS630 family transposase ISMex18 n=1 Tax=Methylobacterium iners TaxID=418707 RepID=A0ABQ4S240_9HYPH|nr:IS630 family transposase [Methylobacterium iners]GJD95847.1 IS630 family transposase ISMex18 [Methylobacterium iners]